MLSREGMIEEAGRLAEKALTEDVQDTKLSPITSGSSPATKHEITSLMDEATKPDPLERHKAEIKDIELREQEINATIQDTDKRRALLEQTRRRTNSANEAIRLVREDATRRINPTERTN